MRRVEARLTVDDEELGPAPGVLGAWAVGAARWQPGERTARIDACDAGRVLVIGAGRSVESLRPAGERLRATLATAPTVDPAALVQHLQTLMRQAESDLAQRLADEAEWVLADGPIRSFEARPVVGYVKSQRVSYLPPEAARLLAVLEPGQRTPLLSIGGPLFARWSWYQRIARVPGGHSWSGIARLECSGSHSLRDAAALADSAAAILPRLAAPLHVDSRAPQNLLPIGALELRLRHLLGDQALVWRRAREAARETLGRAA